MSSHPHRQSSRRKIWSSIFGRSCFGSSSSHISSSVSHDSLPLLSEKISFHPTVRPSSQPKSLPATPPRLTRWPSKPNLKTRRSVITDASYNVASTPPPDERPLNPKTKNRNGNTLGTELTDQFSLMDTANYLGAGSGVVGAGYAAATYHQQRAQNKEARRREEDLELGQRREDVPFGISIENRQLEHHSGQEQVRLGFEESRGEELERRRSLK